MNGKTAKKIRKQIESKKREWGAELLREIKSFKFFDRLKIAFLIVRGN